MDKPAVRITLVGMICLTLAMGIGRFLYTPMLPMMQADGLLSISDGGLLASIHFLGYLLGALFAARVPTHPKTTLRLSLFTIAFCTLGMGMTDSFVAWSVMRLATGICSAFSLVLVSNYFLKALAEAGHAGAQGHVFGGVGLGTTLAGLGALVFMGLELSSSAGWMIFGVFALILAFGLSISIGEEINVVRAQTTENKTQSGALPWRLIIPYGALGFGYIIPATYLPVMAREVVTSPLVFGWAWPILGIAAIISTLIASRLQQNFSQRQIWVVTQIILGIGLVLPIINPHLMAIIVAGICVGGTFVLATMMGLKETHRLASDADSLRDLAAMTAAFATGQIVGPVFASALYDVTGNFSASLGLSSLVLVGSLLTLRK